MGTQEEDEIIENPHPALDSTDAAFSGFELSQDLVPFHYTVWEANQS